MSCASCGSDAAFCGCCEGTRVLTPVSEYNRPGLDALHYRAGTHGSFLETMKARLAGMTVEIGGDGRPRELLRPLQGLTTRDSGDPAIALLDGWACVADVLTFYQQRIANEGFLRTATERRSVLELARLVGYRLRPGVAASVYLAYTLDDKQVEPVEIPPGSRVQSVPGPDELPQVFETSEALLARGAWNNLQVRRTRPQDITLANALSVARLYAAGANLGLASGDMLLLSFGDAGEVAVLRTVAAADGQFADGRTEIALQPVPLPVATVTPGLAELVHQIKLVAGPDPRGATGRALEEAEALLAAQYLGQYSDPSRWAAEIVRHSDGEIEPPVDKLIGEFADWVAQQLKNLPRPPGPVVTSPAQFVDALLKPRRPQAASSLQLERTLQTSFAPGSDAHAQLLVNFAAQLKDSYYAAWAGANVNAAAPSLHAIHVLRLKAPLFGATVARQPTYDADHELKPQSEWKEWDLADDENPRGAFLDQAYDTILADRPVMVQTREGNSLRRGVYRIVSADTVQRSAYGISAKTTELTFDRDWWDGVQDAASTWRGTLVYPAGEALTLAGEPLGAEVGGQEIELAGLHQELTSGRWLLFSGERADIPGVSGVRTSELLMISGLRHGYDPALPGDQTHTTLLLATPTAYAYRRDSLAINANVVKATHGETRHETLGSGNGAALQSFALKQPPLTFVAAPTPAGAASTLQVFVDGVAWSEAETLAGADATQRGFVTSTGDDDRTVLTFGNGHEGARVPTGIENVKAVYRQGIGAPGNVRAGQISLLLSRPLGVQAVTNPLRASGGANREDIGQARENTPLAVMALDRLVSIQDYADFTRTFAGIAKASARRLSDGRRQLVHLTVAGADDAPIDTASDLYRNLLIGLRRFGDPALPVQVAPRELLILVLSANIALAAGHQWEPTALRVRAALLDRMGFQRRALGEPARLCEVISLIQNTEGVAWVNVTAFGGIPEKKAEANGVRRLLTLDELAATVAAVDHPAPRVDANAAAFEAGALRPAQLAIFSAAVADTIILNQID